MARMIEGYTPTTAKGVATSYSFKGSNAEFTANAKKNGPAQRAAQDKVTSNTPLLSRDATPLSGAPNDGKIVGQVSAALKKLTTSTPSSSGSRGGGGGGGGGGGSAAPQEDPYERVMQLIRETSDANNAWAAEQAQKQMDFQERMSSSAHVREVKDLQAAGLNPVLSAGGSGASTPSGAMASPDTSNTRLLAEVAMESINAMAQTASGVSGVAKKATEKSDGSFLGNLVNAYSNNKLVKKVVDTGLGTASKVASYAISRSIMRSVAKAAVKAVL